MNRISVYEEKFDKITHVLNNLEKSINELDNIKEDIIELLDYYNGKDWLKDYDDYNNGKIKDIKAGILSEDAIWNMCEKLQDLPVDLNIIYHDIDEGEKRPFEI